MGERQPGDQETSKEAFVTVQGKDVGLGNGVKWVEWGDIYKVESNDCMIEGG